MGNVEEATTGMSYTVEWWKATDALGLGIMFVEVDRVSLSLATRRGVWCAKLKVFETRTERSRDVKVFMSTRTSRCLDMAVNEWLDLKSFASDNICTFRVRTEYIGRRFPRSTSLDTDSISNILSARTPKTREQLDPICSTCWLNPNKTTLEIRYCCESLNTRCALLSPFDKWGSWSE